jgi:hypothetical protein
VRGGERWAEGEAVELPAALVAVPPPGALGVPLAVPLLEAVAAEVHILTVGWEQTLTIRVVLVAVALVALAKLTLSTGYRR